MPPYRAGVRGPGGEPRILLSRALQIVGVALAYYVAARLSLLVALVGKSVTPVWPPTGIALVALLVFGYRVWPGITVAAFAVNAPISPSLLAAGAIALGNTAAPLLGAHLLRRAGFRAELDRLKDALALVFLGALLSMLVSATVGATTLVVSGAVPAYQYAATWAVWWTGDAMGILIFAPFLLVLRSARLRRRIPLGRRIEGAALIVGIGVVSPLILLSDLRLRYLLLPFLIWAAWRFQQRGAAPAALVVSGVATWSAVRGVGAFAEGPLLERMVNLQVFNATVSLTALVLAAAPTERLRAREALEGSAKELERRVRERAAELAVLVERLAKGEQQLAESQRVAHLGSWEWDMSTDTLTPSDELCRLYGLEPRPVALSSETFLQRVHPDDRERCRAQWSERVLTTSRSPSITASCFPAGP